MTFLNSGTVLRGSLRAGLLGAAAAMTLALPAFAQDGAQSFKLSDDVAKQATGLIEADTDRLVAMFKDIHQNPELGFQETRTAGIIADELKSLGFEVKTGIGKTGVVGILKNGEGPTVMYRADMDANEIKEGTGLDYASTKRVLREDGLEVPVGHMCGHDAHVTWMLGMAKAMADMKDQWSGTLVLVGQPAEELIEGAAAMIDDGFYTTHAVPKPDYLIGMHTGPGPVGAIASVGGAVMAGTDQIDIEFHGIGGHGSMPQQTKDPVVMASYAVTLYQAIVGRVLAPTETGVLSIASIRAGNNNNIIPEDALVQANLRWFDESVREKLSGGLTSVSNGVAKMYGIEDDKMPTITMKGHAPPLVNDEELSLRMADMLKAQFGDEAVVTDMPPGTGSEDAHLLKGDHDDIALNYMFVGIVDPDRFKESFEATGQPPYGLHTPEFMVDLDAIPIGARVATLSMLDLLSKD